ncbi:MAG TPA: hypothetical protein VLS87_09965 [Woeseiaceae bacterium]|nr:hypothetical protein [Woeseiaceae bacterium]
MILPDKNAPVQCRGIFLRPLLADSVEKLVVEAAVVVAIFSMRASCSGVAGFFVF